MSHNMHKATQGGGDSRRGESVNIYMASSQYNPNIDNEI